jgi:hypothetical protein
MKYRACVCVPLLLRRTCSCNPVVLSGVRCRQILGTSDLWVLAVTLAEVPHTLSLPSDLGDHPFASRGHSSMDPVRQQTSLYSLSMTWHKCQLRRVQVVNVWNWVDVGPQWMLLYTKQKGASYTKILRWPSTFMSLRTHTVTNIVIHMVFALFAANSGPFWEATTEFRHVKSYLHPQTYKMYEIT